MKPPRDFNSEIAALKEKEKALRNKRIIELGQLVIATGAADALPMNVLAGVLVASTEDKNDIKSRREDYETIGREFFQRDKRKAGERAAVTRPPLKAVSPDAA